MDQLRCQLPFCSKFYDCKLLEMLYLFVSQQSVILKDRVMLTDKTGHHAHFQLPIGDLRLSETRLP
jgi:hypothetical protein